MRICKKIKGKVARAKVRFRRWRDLGEAEKRLKLVEEKVKEARALRDTKRMREAIQLIRLTNRSFLAARRVYLKRGDNLQVEQFSEVIRNGIAAIKQLQIEIQKIEN